MREWLAVVDRGQKERGIVERGRRRKMSLCNFDAKKGYFV